MVQTDISIERIFGDIEEDLLEAASASLRKVKEDIDPYVPYKTGKLSNSAVVNKYEIVWTAPYANYVYNRTGVNFDKSVHPKATDHWVEHARDEIGDKIYGYIENEFAKRRRS